MKYKVLRDFLFLKKDETIETDVLGYYNRIRCHTICGELSAKLQILLSDYPNDFAPISEKEEQIEEAKKLLEGEGWSLIKPGIIPEGTPIYRCEKCNQNNCF